MYVIEWKTCLLFCIWRNTLQPPFSPWINSCVSLSSNVSHIPCDKRFKCGHIQSTCLYTTFSRHHWKTHKNFNILKRLIFIFIYFFLQIFRNNTFDTCSWYANASAANIQNRNYVECNIHCFLKRAIQSNLVLLKRQCQVL